MKSLETLLRWIAFPLIFILAPAFVEMVGAQDANRAALVVSLGDGEIVTRCVPFEEPQISGFDLLARSGLALETEVVGLGATVCSIESSGCPADDCWCQCTGGGDCLYWSYWLNQDGAWRYAQVGSGVFKVSDGDIQGWVWDVGSPNEAPPPPDLAFEDVCQAAGPEPAAEAAPGLETPAADSAGGADWGGYAAAGLVAVVLAAALGLVQRRRGS